MTVTVTVVITRVAGVTDPADKGAGGDGGL